MGEVTTIGLDLAKNVFQLHGVDAEGATVLRKQLRRAQVLTFFSRLPRCLVGLEACATAHYWARELRALGHEVRLMPAQYVKAYVKRNKNDAADAAAICEAVMRQDVVGLPKLAVLTLQRLQLLCHIRRNTGRATTVAIRLLHPLMQRLRRAADLRRNRAYRRPARSVLAFVIQNQPHRTGADLGRELVCRFARHGSTFSRVGASDQPGAVHRRLFGPTMIPRGGASQ